MTFKTSAKDEVLPLLFLVFSLRLVDGWIQVHVPYPERDGQFNGMICSKEFNLNTCERLTLLARGAYLEERKDVWEERQNATDAIENGSEDCVNWTYQFPPRIRHARFEAKCSGAVEYENQVSVRLAPAKLQLAVEIQSNDILSILCVLVEQEAYQTWTAIELSCVGIRSGYHFSSLLSCGNTALSSSARLSHGFGNESLSVFQCRTNLKHGEIYEIVAKLHNYGMTHIEKPQNSFILTSMEAPLKPASVSLERLTYNVAVDQGSVIKEDFQILVQLQPHSIYHSLRISCDCTPSDPRNEKMVAITSGTKTVNTTYMVYTYPGKTYHIKVETRSGLSGNFSYSDPWTSGKLYAGIMLPQDISVCFKRQEEIGMVAFVNLVVPTTSFQTHLRLTLHYNDFDKTLLPNSEKIYQLPNNSKKGFQILYNLTSFEVGKFYVFGFEVGTTECVNSCTEMEQMANVIFFKRVMSRKFRLVDQLISVSDEPIMVSANQTTYDYATSNANLSVQIQTFSIAPKIVFNIYAVHLDGQKKQKVHDSDKRYLLSYLPSLSGVNTYELSYVFPAGIEKSYQIFAQIAFINSADLCDDFGEELRDEVGFSTAVPSNIVRIQDVPDEEETTTQSPTTTYLSATTITTSFKTTVSPSTPKVTRGVWLPTTKESDIAKILTTLIEVEVTEKPDVQISEGAASGADKLAQIYQVMASIKLLFMLLMLL